MTEPTPIVEQPIRVLVVDDHPLLREGLTATIRKQPDLDVVGEAIDGVGAIEQFQSLSPDVTLMDIQMPQMGGIEAIEKIREIDPRAAIVVLTTYPGDSQAMRALKAGASGYLLKSCIRKDLLQTIRAVHAGERAISAEVAQAIAMHAMEERLSEREASILRLIAEGHPNKQIAWQLNLAQDTIKGHLKNIFAKLDVTDRTHAVVVAVRRGFIDL
ncbi:DNA-binding NarL/FixJ family response regulator [Sphingobium sp. B2D3A]|uniref:response regulator n=1 Tax=unclassified Sphingobium TaxID=2611147 RepID=UPI002225935B|nr:MULTISPECIES: response regulator transcription factor [unclassified Sphingobium]MCW2338224.1 DNA-binding NarL/FixJ family response regulator [Sphingobium sp. B2D3A]MCW2384682.1 DNA-binding NarL/FixJ family response regulator [Sphingobium sp. B2D3D]